MKKNLLTILSVALLFACSPKEKEEVELLNDGNQIAEYALDLDSAIQYVNRYDSIAKASLKDTIPFKAFTVRAVDLLEALGLPENTKVKYTHARIYLGMDQNDHFRLFFTPVQGASIKNGEAGQDVILKGPHKHGLAEDAKLQLSNGSYVLDFTAPCPNTCPNGSPLNQ
ncbi:MAG: hypothetical protein HOP30_19285 [Cyclobacteriaceae bacterium]|nr:hypothetical protein [Cyclobacteriaceae bacterium]